MLRVPFARYRQQRLLNRWQGIMPEPGDLQPELWKRPRVIDAIGARRYKLIAPALIKLIELCSLRSVTNEPVL